MEIEKKKRYEQLIEILRETEYGETLLDYAFEIADTIETLLSERKYSGWISVNDRLPKCNGGIQKLLVCRSQRSSTHGNVLIDTEYFTDSFCGNDNITHWMPLPASPEAE